MGKWKVIPVEAGCTCYAFKPFSARGLISSHTSCSGCPEGISAETEFRNAHRECLYCQSSPASHGASGTRPGWQSDCSSLPHSRLPSQWTSFPAVAEPAGTVSPPESRAPRNSACQTAVRSEAKARPAVIEPTSGTSGLRCTGSWSGTSFATLLLPKQPSVCCIDQSNPQP